jgi:hypothetical protein
MTSQTPTKKYGAKCRTIDLAPFLNWPDHTPNDEWWGGLAGKTRELPEGKQDSWGIPFYMPGGDGSRAIMVTKESAATTIDVNARADYLCFLHSWQQIPSTLQPELPREGMVVAEYELLYEDGECHVQPMRARFEVFMNESPGTPWLAMPFIMTTAIAPDIPRGDMNWGSMQPGLYMGGFQDQPIVVHYALENPRPKKKIVSIAVRGCDESPFLVCGLTLFRGTSHPLRHLPKRRYRIKGDSPTRIENVEIDLGVINRTEKTDTPRGKAWLESDHVGSMRGDEITDKREDLLEITAAPDATVSVTLEGKKKPLEFSLGEAFDEGSTASGGSEMRILDRHHQWMKIRIIDTSTGKPTAARLHMSGSRGQYIAPYGHHEHVNTNWFEDYAGDLRVGDRNFAYVHGEFTSDMPVGDIYVEVSKGFEYTPTRIKVRIKPGQKKLDLPIDRWTDLRSKGWVTADTHVHFISPHTAWLEGMAEGVNVVNLLASQWGRLFTNVGDYTGRVGVVENDTIVYVGTENRNHMLGHMSMLGTNGLPVYPMCAGGPTEADIGDPDFVTLAEWAVQNKKQNGVVIRPHFPYCGYTEDPVPIISGLVDALEIGGLHGDDFPTQEWYRYLNCGYRVSVAGGTDKMSAGTALGWLRTYAKLDPNAEFTYDAWAEAVRAGRTYSSNGPIIDMSVDGRELSDTIEMSTSGGKVEVRAHTESFWPLAKLEIVRNGKVVAIAESKEGTKRLEIKEKIKVPSSGWIAARCSGVREHAAHYVAAHTSPIYVKCGDTRAFDGPGAEHMLQLVTGGIEYLNTLATVYDEDSRKRMVKLYKEVEKELGIRLKAEPHVHSH